MKEKRWLNPVEFEIEFGIKRSTQAKMRMAYKIPFSKVGKFIRYDRTLINKWLEEHSLSNMGEAHG